MGKLGIVVVASCLDSGIACKMLCAGHNGSRIGKVLALEAAHPSRSEFSTKIRVFPAGLHHSAPSAVNADVHHRRIGELKAC